MYRVRHQSPPLAWSLKLQESAQIWAETLAREGRLEHGGHEGVGQNLAFCAGKLTGVQACKLWYDELRAPGYTFEQPGFTHGTGHFTQVVWRTSKLLGIGIAQGVEGTYVVAHYEPAGNGMGQFQMNVLPPDRDLTEI